MAFVLIQQHVKDFAAWKKVYDSSAGLRKSFGELSAQVYQAASDPSAVTLLFKWDSLANAQKFAAHSALKEAQQKAGVEGEPSVSFLSEA